MRRAACILVLAAPLGAVACSSFGSVEPPVSGPDASSSAEAGPVLDAAADAPPPGVIDAGSDAAKPIFFDCVGAAGVDFCSDFESPGLAPPWTLLADPSTRLNKVPSDDGKGQLLSIPIPTDSQPTTAFLYHDVPSTTSFRFGVDVTIPQTVTGDYVTWFAIESIPTKTDFSLQLRIDANATFAAYESDIKVADFGASTMAGTMRLEGTVVFAANATTIEITRNGAAVTTTAAKARPAPTGLRIAVGLVYAEAIGGGTVKVDNVLYDTP